MVEQLIQLHSSLRVKADAGESLHKKKLNLLALKETIQLADDRIRNKPLQLFLEITSRCNLRCRKCGMNYDPARLKAQNIPISLLARLQEFYESAVEVNTFGYGEMFLYRDLPGLVEMLKLHNCRVAGITNGTRIEKEDVSWLVSSQYDELTFSIDGATPATMRRLRGADLKKILEVLALLKDEKQRQGADLPEIVVNFTAQKDNFRELPELIRLLANLDVFFFGVNTLHHFSGPVDEYGEFYRNHCLANVNRDAVEAIINESQLLAQNAGIDFVNHIDMDFEWGPKTKNRMTVNAADLSPYYCLYPWMTLYLAADRTTKVCCYMSAEQNLGEFSDSSDINEIWHGPQLTEIRNHIKRGQLHPACRVCVEHGAYKTYEAVLRVVEQKLEDQAAIPFSASAPSEVNDENNGIESVFEGYHDIANCRVIQGWVWDINHPERAVRVEIYDGEKLLTIVTANEFRKDLLDSGKGDGHHSFTYKVPHSLRDGQSHSIMLRAAGHDFKLGSTPKPIQCG